MTRRGTGAVVAALAMVVGCTGARGALVEAPVELAIAPVGKLADSGIVTNGEREGACSLALTAGRLQKSSRGCYLDEHIDEASGILHYACNGSGPAEAEFGDHRYVGRIEDGQLELELTGELDWEDGCRWGTRAAISGKVTRAGGEPTFDQLSWTYADRVIAGSPCSGVCTAKTRIEVSDPKASRRALPPDDEADDSEDD